jgi:hypothetical protein
LAGFKGIMPLLNMALKHGQSELDLLLLIPRYNETDPGYHSVFY